MTTEPVAEFLIHYNCPKCGDFDVYHSRPTNRNVWCQWCRKIVKEVKEEVIKDLTSSPEPVEPSHAETNQDQDA